MNAPRAKLPRRTLLLASLGLFLALAGCSSSTGPSPIHGSVYYGYGWGDPYFYGSPWYNNNVVIMPPPHRPSRPPVRPMPRPTVPVRPMPRG